MILNFIILWMMMLYLLYPLLALSYAWFYVESLTHFLAKELMTLNWVFSVTVLAVTGMVWYFSTLYMSHSNSVWAFNIWLLLFVLSMLFLLISSSWWLLFLGWEGLGLTSFWLVAFYGSWTAHNGSLLTFLTNRLGDCCLLSTSLYWLNNLSTNNFVYFNSFMWIMLMMGLMTKSAQLPFMSWLPAAMAAPTPISALVHSSTLVTAGLYLLIKFHWMHILSSSFSFWLGFLTLSVGSYCALLDSDLKKVVAFSTLSQLGLILFLFTSKSLSIVLYHLVTHAFFKSSLFICVGIMILNHYSNQSSWLFSVMGLSIFSHFSWFLLTILNLTSLFFLSGFYSKEISVTQSLAPISTIFNFLIFSMLSLTLMYGYRLFKNLSYFTSHTLNTKTNFGMVWTGSLLNISLLIGMGHCWAQNFWYVSFDTYFFSIQLLTLWLIPLLISALFLMKLYYHLTASLKVLLNFCSMTNLNQTWNIFYLPTMNIINFSWPSWSFLLIIFLLLFF